MQDFDAMLNARREQFRIGGQVFTRRAKVPMIAYLEAINRLGAAATREENREALEAFYRLVLVKADRDRFVALLNADPDDDDEGCVSLEQSRLLSDWVSSRLAGKADENETSSTPGPEPTGQSSNVVSLSRGPTAAAAG